MCKISIIIPVYNVEKYLTRCLNSVIGQTFSDWEAIIVNDGSDDGSEHICKSFASKDNRFQYIYKKNGGLSDARNVGIDNSKGQYICFLDSDDWLELNYLEELYNRITQDRSDIVVCGYYNSTDVDNLKICVTERNMLIDKVEFIHRIANNDIQSFAWNKLFDAKLFETHRFKRGVLYEDVYFMNEILSEIECVSLVEKSLYHYYMRSDSLVHLRNFKREYDYFSAFLDRYNRDIIASDDKKHIVKLLLISYYYIIESVDVLSKNLYNDYLGNISKQEISEAKKLLSKMERIRFGFAVYFPVFYKLVISKLRK